MTLPSVREVGIYHPWSQHKIETRTLELRPFEKPDMSPYLVHMTTRNAILSILQSGEPQTGQINAEIPSQSQSEWYDHKIVCFTESPLFAIDLFRYKSHQRWLDDLRYGIGFSKISLAQKGVRPALYVDRSSIIRKIRELKKIILNEDEYRDRAFFRDIKNIYYELAPLITPLDHDHPQQGFMWEREWRYASEEGFIFDYSDIKVICCPEEEVHQIAAILGDYSSHIKFIQTWGQYEEVSDYLVSRRNSDEMRLIVKDTRIHELETAKLQLKKELSKLEAYNSYLTQLSKQIEKVEAVIPEIKSKIEVISNRLERQEYLRNHCCKCNTIFQDSNLTSAFRPVIRRKQGEFEDGLETWVCVNC